MSLFGCTSLQRLMLHRMALSCRCSEMPPKKRDDKRIDAEEAAKEDIGKYYFADGSYYDGQFVRKGEAVKRHGAGMYFDGGAVYDGQWSDDEMHGEGTITFDTGATYSGTFANNQFHGRGKYLWPNGTSYDGQWRRSLMHGEGVYVDAQGRRWTGRFYDGRGFQLIQEV
jgi:hypothetical protein